jgi:DNA-3-methyladenine glycosylase
VSAPWGLRLPRSFFDRSPDAVAPDLLGRVVRHRTEDGSVAVRLTEVEAYAGVGEDPASHAFRGPTPRNASMFAHPGTCYVYFTYGMHWCANLVCGPRGSAGAVLLRAGRVVEGEELARSRRPAARGSVDLAQGPARLAVSLGVDGAVDGVDVCARGSALTVLDGQVGDRSEPAAGSRVGVGESGAHTQWRYWTRGDPTVSRYRPGRGRS